MKDSSGQPPLRAASIAATLEAEIITGQITGGTKLDEQGLAERFNVSRTPVREALHLLAARSLVERVPYRGVVVLDITPERIEQMFEAMAEIEALCGRYSAQRMSIGERGALQALHDDMQEMAQRGAAKEYEAANTRFHAMIYEGAHNADIAELADTLRLKLAPFRRTQLKSAKRMEKSSAEHQDIVNAIVDNDPSSAERALRRHLMSAAQEVLGQLR